MVFAIVLNFIMMILVVLAAFSNGGLFFVFSGLSSVLVNMITCSLLAYKLDRSEEKYLLLAFLFWTIPFFYLLVTFINHEKTSRTEVETVYQRTQISERAELKKTKQAIPATGTFQPEPAPVTAQSTKDITGLGEDEIAYLQQALKMPDPELLPLLDEIDALIDKLRFPEALALVEPVLEKYPGDLNLRFRKAMTFFGLERIADAKREYEILRKIHPTGINIRAWYADFLSRNDEYEKAAELFSQVIFDNEIVHSPLFWESFYISLVQLKRFHDITNYLEKGLTAAPELGHIPYLLSLYYFFQENDHSKAESMMRMALDRNAKNKAELYLKLSIHASYKGRNDEAARMLSNARSHKLENEQDHYLMSVALYNLHQYDESRRHVRIALQLAPDYTPAINQMARLNSSQRQVASQPTSSSSSTVEIPRTPSAHISPQYLHASISGKHPMEPGGAFDYDPYVIK